MLSNRKGFTLIELLIVVVIIGILAAIAIPKFATTKEKAYIGAMKSDLRNLATAQEAFFSDSLYYVTAAADVTQAAPLVAGGDTLLTPSTGVTIKVKGVAPVAGKSQAGWQAAATHSATDTKCGIFMNTTKHADAPATNTTESEPQCGTK